MEQEYKGLYLCLHVSNFQSTQEKDHASHRVRLSESVLVVKEPAVLS